LHVRNPSNPHTQNSTSTTSSPRRATPYAPYGDLGFDRLLFHPAVASLDQVDRLADAVL
jgi:hypothetical protein